MLNKTERGTWALPDGRELIVGNMIEVCLDERWILGRVGYENELQRYVISLDGGTLLISEEMDLRFPYDTLPKPQREDVSSLWTVDDVAAYLRFLPSTVRTLARRGEIPAMHIGKAWRFRAKDVLLWVDSHPQNPGQAE